MAVQMILGNVCDRTCRRMELFDGFQLEATDLGNRYGIICRVECLGCTGVPMFPTTFTSG